MKNSDSVVPVERIEKEILPVRGLKVMIHRDLAMLYGLETGILNQVKRNR